MANAALPVCAVVTSPILARSLGPAERGILASLLAPLLVAPLIFSLGQQESVTYHLVRKLAHPRSVHRSGLRLAAGLGLCALVSLEMLAPILARKEPSYVAVIRVAAIYPLLILLLQVVRARLIAAGQFAAITTERWMQAGVRLVGLVALAVTHDLTVTSALLLQLGSTVVGSCSLLLWRRRNQDPLIEESPLFRRSLVSSLASFGTRNWVGGVGSILMLRLDQLLMPQLTNAAELGKYAVAVSLAEVPLAIGTALRIALLPSVDAAKLGEVVPLWCRRLVSIAGAVLIVGTPTVPFLLPKIFGQSFAGASVMAVILLFACVPAVMIEIVSGGLVAAGRPGRQATGPIAGVLATLVVLPILVPSLGGVGAALTSVVAYSLGARIAISQLRAVIPGLGRMLPTPATLRADARLVGVALQRRKAKAATVSVRADVERQP